MASLVVIYFPLAVWKGLKGGGVGETSTTGVHVFVVAQVVARGDAIHPVLVVEIPAHGFLDALFKLEGGFPTQFVFELRGVDGVAQVVAGAVGDVGDEVEIGVLGAAEQAIDGCAPRGVRYRCCAIR